MSGGKKFETAPVIGWPLDLVILSRRRRISVRGEYDVIGIHAGAWYTPLPADWYLTASYYLLFLPRSFAYAQDDGGRREEIEAAPVMGWPLDLVILSRRRRISVRGEYDVIGIHAGAWYSAPSRRLVFNCILLLTALTEILRFALDDGGRREGMWRRLTSDF